MIPFRQSIGFRLLGISIILLAIPVLVDSFIFFATRFDLAENHLKAVLLQETKIHATPFEKLTKQDKEFFNLLKYFLNLETAFPQKETQELDHSLSQLAQLNQVQAVIIAKYTSEGRFVTVATSDDQFAHKDVSDIFLPLYPFSEIVVSEGAVTGLTYDQVTDATLLVTVKPIYNEQQIRLGGIAVVNRMNKGIQDLLSPVSYPFPINFSLVLPSSVIFAASESKMQFQHFRPLSEEEYAKVYKIFPAAKTLLPTKPLKVNWKDKRPFFSFYVEGKKQIAMLDPLANSELSLLAYVSNKVLLSKPTQEFLRICGTYFIVLAIGLIVAYFLTKRFTKPISSLSQVMSAIESGDLQARYTHDRIGFELNRLGDIFNDMVDELLKKEKEIEEQRIAKETIAKELKLGREVQKQLLPKTTPEYAGIEFGYAFSPAIDVGGDFFDIYVKPDGKLVFAVADASGKGVYACLYSLTLKNMLKTMACYENDVYEAMRQANNLLCDDTGDTGMFVTVFMGQYDHRTKEFEHSSCGHNPILIYQAREKKTQYVAANEMAMGVLPREKPFSADKLKLQSQDIVVMYSDGVTEAHNLKQELFGEERLERFIQLEAHRPASELVTLLMDELRLFSGGAKQHDDITIIIMKVT